LPTPTTKFLSQNLIAVRMERVRAGFSRGRIWRFDDYEMIALAGFEPTFLALEADNRRTPWHNGKASSVYKQPIVNLSEFCVVLHLPMLNDTFQHTIGSILIGVVRRWPVSYDTKIICHVNTLKFMIGDLTETL
jgi:hypothetical protein